MESVLPENPAANRFHEFGWHAVDPHPQLVNDTLSTPSFGLARGWSPRGTFSLCSSERRLYALLVVDGQASLSATGWQTEIRTGQLVLLRGERSVRTRTDGPFTQFLCYLHSRILRAPLYRSALETPMTIGEAGQQMIVSMSNAILNSAQERSSSVLGHLRTAVEHLLVSLVLEHPRYARASEGIPLVVRAESVIERCFREQSFDVTSLVEELRVSRATLYRAFETIGTTPWAEIDRRRVAEAERILGDYRRTAGLGAVATAVGYPSGRQLRTARSRWNSKPPGAPLPEPRPERSVQTGSRALT